MRDAMMRRLAELRHEPTEKRVRARIGGETVVDSRRALLVWEPRRVVCEYAVPEEDVRAELLPAEPVEPSDAPVLHPGIPFAHHSTPGEPLHVRVAGETREQAAFRPADADLAGHVLLAFKAFDGWLEEAEEVVSHPRDPYHRVDTRRSDRPVRIEVDDRVVAESTRATFVYETGLPTRFYLPREDVAADLTATAKRTYCPYKGRASYWSLEGHDDVAWTYADPLPDAVALAGDRDAAPAAAGRPAPDQRPSCEREPREPAAEDPSLLLEANVAARGERGDGTLAEPFEHQ
jgi:uncharacterized protein (DUF427 family)